MKCHSHPDIEASGICAKCGKAVCPSCTIKDNYWLICISCSQIRTINKPQLYLDNSNHKDSIPHCSFLWYLVVILFGPLGTAFAYSYLMSRNPRCAKSILFAEICYLLFIVFFIIIFYSFAS